ncbi:hypothetical protein ZWY2020_049890 [Hordeum vulgare]|nr:hypothetical protein ZWY2020_049890 [Hordeum vulgare]
MVTWPRYGDQFFNEKLVMEVLQVGASVGACDYASFMETHHGVVRAEVVAESIGTVMGDGEEGQAIRSKARELGVKARWAVGNAGSSYGDVGRLMEVDGSPKDLGWLEHTRRILQLTLCLFVVSICAN